MSLKHRSQFSSTLDNKLKSKLKELSDETKIPISKLLDESIELLLRERGYQLTPQKHPNLKVADNNEPYRIDINLPDDK